MTVFLLEMYNKTAQIKCCSGNFKRPLRIKMLMVILGVVCDFFPPYFISTVTFGGVLLSYSAWLLSESAAVLMEGSHTLLLSEPDTSSWQQNRDL